MSNPQSYKRGSAFGANVSGSLLNDELDAVAKASTSTNDALADVRRSDGELKDRIVKSIRCTLRLTRTLKRSRLTQRRLLPETWLMHGRKR